MCWWQTDGVQLPLKFTRVRCGGRIAERWSPKELVVARAAVSIASVLFEVPQLKPLHAEGTGKVLWVELLPHGVDTVPQDRLLALCAERAPRFVVVQLTVGLALVLKEIHLWEVLAAGLWVVHTGGWGGGSGGEESVQSYNTHCKCTPPHETVSAWRVWRPGSMVIV